MGTAPACATIWGFEEGLPGELGQEGGTGSSGASSGGAATDARPDAPLPETPDTPPPPGCEERVPDAAAIYVDLYASGDNESCSHASPCKSIQHAIGLATSERHVIYLAKGRYDESIRVDGTQLGLGIVLEGRWDHGTGAWLPYCDADDNGTEVYGTTERALEVVAAAPPDGGASDGGQPNPSDAGSTPDVELRYLTLQGPPPRGDGTSSFGIFARGTHVVLTYASVIADFGGPGRTPSDQERPVAETGEPSCGLNSGGNGMQGVSGASLPRGSYTRDGYVPAITAEPKAESGNEGACTSVCNNKAAGGKPGINATSGGASIAAYLWDAELVVGEKSGLVAFGGGNGGDGGLGGDGATSVCNLNGSKSIGGPGGVGSPGAGGPGACIVTNDASKAPALNGTLCGAPREIAQGGRGGPGVATVPGDRDAVIVATPEAD